MAVTGMEPVSTADLKMACDALGEGIQSAQQAASSAQAAAGTAQSGVDGLDTRVTALEGSVVPPLTMFPVGSILFFLHDTGGNPGAYLGGEWYNDGNTTIGRGNYTIWRRIG